MLRERSELIVLLHRLSDIVLTLCAFIAAYFIKRHLPTPFNALSLDPNYYIILLMIVIIWYPTFSLMGLYKSHRREAIGRILGDMVKAVCVGMGILILCLYVFKITGISRILLGIFFLMNIILLGLSKGFAFKILGYYRSRQFNFRNILVIGSGERAKEAINAIGMHPDAGYRILGCLETDPSRVGLTVQDEVRVIGLINDLRNILSNTVVDEIIIAMPVRKIEGQASFMTIAEKFGVTIRIVPDWQIPKIGYSPRIAHTIYENFFGYPTMVMSTTSPRKEDLLIKNAMDYVCAGFVFIMLTPLFAFISIAIKLSSKGPVLYQQERNGLNGRHFKVYKFRTMTVDAEEKRRQLEDLNESDGPVFKIRNDPRVIPYIGTFLRKTSLDELPQLINILKGEMSMVGPRPLPVDEVEKCDDWQRRRLSMKPGLTCIWQTMPERNDIPFNEWMKLDLQYIDNWSLGLDFRLLLKTVRVVVLGQGR